MTLKDLLRKVSQLFFWGFEGTKVSSDLRKLLKNYPPAGLILFRRNIESLSQVKALTRDLQRSAKRKILIGIDQEGGRVARLTLPFIPFPPAEVWGDLGEEASYEAGRLLARELLKLGINTDFAPVLDVNSNPKNPIIGDRAFSSNPKVVAITGTAFYLGMKKEGLLACGKHFPGHGDTLTDSHLELPHVKASRSRLNKIELLPFQQAIQKGIPLLMTAHVVYKALDPKNPATLSHKILHDLLRKKMKFKGVVISDDLNMKAISEKYSEAESSILSLAAGVDLILICKDGEKGGAIVEEVARAVQASSYLQKRVVESCHRINSAARKASLTNQSVV